MTTSQQGPQDVLCAEILAHARSEAEQVLAAARGQAECVLMQAAIATAEARQAQLDAAHEEAERRRAMILAGVPVEVGRRRSARIEDLLQAIRADVQRRLLAREGFDYRASVAALAADAMRGMSGDVFALHLAPADREAWGDGLTGELEQRIGHRLTLTFASDPELSTGGVQVQNDRGSHIWDNRFVSRLERLWPELRRQIAVTAALVPATATPPEGAA